MGEKKKDIIPGLDLTQLDKIHLDDERIQQLPKLDRDFILLRGAMTYISALNALDRAMMGLEREARTLLPNPIEDLKIFISRIEDIKMEELPSLSSAFIEKIFTIEGKPLKVNAPEVGDVNILDFKRDLISNIKTIDEQVAACNAYKTRIKARYEKDIPEEIREIAMDAMKSDEFMLAYFHTKSQDPNLSEQERNNYKKKLKWRDYGITLKPLLDSIRPVVTEKNGIQAFILNFYKTNKKVLSAAIEIAHANNVPFPFNMLTNIDYILFEDKYKMARNLLVYIIARYIKYHRNDLNEYRKIFISEMCANLILISREDADKRYPELYKRMKESIGAVLTLATGVA